MTSGWSVRWPDGRVTSAPTAQSLLESIAEDSFKGEDLLSIRTALARRGQAWSGRDISPNLPVEEFLRELSKAGLFTLEITPG